MQHINKYWLALWVITENTKYTSVFLCCPINNRSKTSLKYVFMDGYVYTHIYVLIYKQTNKKWDQEKAVQNYTHVLDD